MEVLIKMVSYMYTDGIIIMLVGTEDVLLIVSQCIRLLVVIN